MNELILKAFEFLDIPIIVYDLKNSTILYHNSQATPLIEELEKRNFFSDLPSSLEKDVLITKEEPLSKVYIGRPKRLDEEHLLISFEELKRDRPFSGFLFDIIEDLPLLIFLIKDGKIYYVNKAAERLLGHSRDEILGKNLIRDFIWDLDKPKAEMHCKRVMSGLKEEGVYLAIEDKFGRIRNFLWNCFLTRDWNGEMVIVSIASDISEFLELSQKIEKLHKTQTFVEFLRGLVHDFNNLLQTILDYLNKLKSAPLNKMEDILYYLEKSIYSWIDINRILIDYTKEAKEIRFRKIDIIQFLKENIEVFQFILGEKIKLYLDLGYSKKLFTYGDSAFWRYIFLNFLANAKDAMEGEGEVYISICKYEDSANKKQYIKISIKDVGCGIPEENISKIFDPFYTTKEKGSGLGLFIVNHHIKGIEGFIEVESRLGHGTIFHIYVPLVMESPVKVSSKEFDLIDKIIYVVEDDEGISEAIKEFLQAKGAKVYVFKEGEELFKNFSHLEKPHLLIVDLNLPDISGKELVMKMKDPLPDLKVLYLTGDIFILSELPEKKVLLKPFKLEDLHGKVISILYEE